MYSNTLAWLLEDVNKKILDFEISELRAKSGKESTRQEINGLRSVKQLLTQEMWRVRRLNGSSMQPPPVEPPFSTMFPGTL